MLQSVPLQLLIGPVQKIGSKLNLLWVLGITPEMDCHARQAGCCFCIMPLLVSIASCPGSITLQGFRNLNAALR